MGVGEGVGRGVWGWVRVRGWEGVGWGLWGLRMTYYRVRYLYLWSQRNFPIKGFNLNIYIYIYIYILCNYVNYVTHCPIT